MPEGITGNRERLRRTSDLMMTLAPNAYLAKLPKSGRYSVLSEWGFKEKSLRFRDLETPRRGWEFTDAELASVEANLRGEGPIPSEDATTTTTGAVPHEHLPRCEP